MHTPQRFNRNRIVRAMLVAVLGALMLVPLVAQFSGLPPDKPLGGFRYRTREFPHWSPRSWLRRQFADAADAWTGEHFGLRGWLVHLDRQLRYSLFGQVEAAPLRRRALVMGKPPQLFENILVFDAVRPPQIAPDAMETFASRLALVQQLLKQHGMAFLVVLAPNKALIYTDALPAWARKHLKRTDGDAARFVEALRRHDVPCLDTPSLFRELSPQYPDLVPPHAIHWGHQGAWIALQHAVPLLNKQHVFDPLPVPQTESIVMDKPSHMNDELRGQLNLFRSPYDDPIPSAYPVAAPLPAGTEPVLDVLIIGDSFAFTFMDALSRSRLCRGLHLWFYMQSGKEATPSFDSRLRRGIPHIRGMKIGRGSPENARLMLADRNLVLFVVTTFNIDKFTWGFDRLVFNVYGAPDVPPLPGEDDDVDLEN